MQIQHETSKGTINLFFTPVSSDRFKFFDDENPYLSYFVGTKTFRVYVSKGFKLIGFTSDVTEEQAKMMVDKMISSYQDYTDSKVVQTFSLFNALDSFKSVMQHLQVYEVNTYDNYECDNHWCENGYIDMGYNEKMRCQFCQENEDKQDEIEPMVGNWLVLFKPND